MEHKLENRVNTESGNGSAEKELETKPGEALAGMLAEEAAGLQHQLVEWRRALHQMPETGTKLPQTIAFIKERLDEMGITYKVYEDISCIEAVIGDTSGADGSAAGFRRKCFLLRSDIDALPVTEETDLPFRSTNGCMHGCGHDMHGTILLGAAKLLKNHEKELKGTVKLLFQSGEEVFQGAKAAVAAGVLKEPKVEAAFAMHVIAMMPTGVFMTGKEAMASVDGFKITLTGHGGHGSMPETSVDPINAVVQVYLALQSLIAREKGGTEEAVLTIGQLSAGEAANIIPERAVLQGTLRTFQKEVRERLVKRIQEISAGVAAAYRCRFEYETLSCCPSVITDDGVTAQVEESIKSLFPQVQVIKQAHGMGSEDFAEITDLVPSAYYMLGAGPEDPAKRLGQHNPKVEFNEDVLSTGAAIYAKTAMDWLEKN